MPMMVAVPAMMMVMVVLGVRRRGQRSKKRESENSENKLLHEIRPPLSSSLMQLEIQRLIQQSTQLKSP
jgi:hypothetical protein